MNLLKFDEVSNTTKVNDKTSHIRKSSMRCFGVICFYFVIGVFCGILFKKEVYKNKITIEFRKGEII